MIRWKGENMKFYKLKSLIYFFLYRLNRWLGGKTKWDLKDPQATSRYDWEYCIWINSFRQSKRNVWILLPPISKHAILYNSQMRFERLMKELHMAFKELSGAMREYKKTMDELGIEIDENTKKERF